MATIFVGRRDEQDEFVDWMTSEPAGDGGRAALLVGAAGMGKSALLERFEDICLAHTPQRWFVQRVELNPNETPSAFLERLLLDIHRLLAGKYLRKGPRDKRIKSALLKAIPKAGELLAVLVGEDKRPGWLRFADYIEAVSEALAKKDERFVLLIDPDRAMQEGQADEWLSVANKLPPRIRALIAQRPDDVIAAHAEAGLRFRRLPDSATLGELSREQVEHWYQQELDQGRLMDTSRAWSGDTRRHLGAIAHARYGGHPFAHDAIVHLLTTEQPEDPIAAIGEWPREVTALLDMLFSSLARQGEERLRAALTLQVFNLPTPMEVWAQAAGLSTEGLLAHLNDARYAHFFTKGDGSTYMPFHALFAERLERELRSAPRMMEQRAEAAWRAVAPALDEERLRTSKPREFELLAATQVADRFAHEQARERAERSPSCRYVWGCSRPPRLTVPCACALGRRRCVCRAVLRQPGASLPQAWRAGSRGGDAPQGVGTQ